MCYVKILIYISICIVACHASMFARVQTSGTPKSPFLPPSHKRERTRTYAHARAHTNLSLNLSLNLSRSLSLRSRSRSLSFFSSFFLSFSLSPSLPPPLSLSLLKQQQPYNILEQRVGDTALQVVLALLDHFINVFSPKHLRQIHCHGH